MNWKDSFVGDSVRNDVTEPRRLGMRSIRVGSEREGDLALTLEENLALIAHIQIADNPGRHEPGTGEINYPFLFAHLDRLGYAGWIGCEYKPESGTDDGLRWARPYLET